MRAAPDVMSVFGNTATTLLRSIEVCNLTADLRQQILKLPLLLGRRRIQ
ncbi:MAG: hypothetical protein KDA75_01515 [Planctomycetaceae bacterium]|nr:hypothetical protein [Planctomycetaceae bacterium]